MSTDWARRCWNFIFGLNYELSIWVEEEDLGKQKLIHHKNQRYMVRIPQEINQKITLRLRGLGRTRIHKTGDLLLHIWLNKGYDVKASLWLSETTARNGGKKSLFTAEETIVIVIPPKSYDGLTIRLKGCGRGPSFSPRAPVLNQKKRGNLLVKLFVYPDSITPNYGSFDALSTQNMALEGLVYRKYDEMIQKLGKASLPLRPIQASVIADLFNEGEYLEIFNALVEHFKLARLNIKLVVSASLTNPGGCERTMKYVRNFWNILVRKCDYKVLIKEQFIDNPFSIAAIMAHELCHVVYFEKITATPNSFGQNGQVIKTVLEDERAVDLLVFMYQMGEFQLRVARDTRLTLGYFNQEVFERMQVIVSRKMTAS